MNIDRLAEMALGAADLSESARNSAEASHMAGDDRFALVEAVTETRSVLPGEVLDAIDGYLAEGPLFGDDSSLDEVLRQHVASMRAGRVRTVA